MYECWCRLCRTYLKRWHQFSRSLYPKYERHIKNDVHKQIIFWHTSSRRTRCAKKSKNINDPWLPINPRTFVHSRFSSVAINPTTVIIRSSMLELSRTFEFEVVLILASTRRSDFNKTLLLRQNVSREAITGKRTRISLFCLSLSLSLSLMNLAWRRERSP